MAGCRPLLARGCQAALGAGFSLLVPCRSPPTPSGWHGSQNVSGGTGLHQRFHVFTGVVTVRAMLFELRGELNHEDASRTGADIDHVLQNLGSEELRPVRRRARAQTAPP